MGYTNYFSIKHGKKEFSPSVINKVKTILSTYEKTYGEILVKGFFHRYDTPTVNKDCIQFNVTSDGACEDFCLDLNGDMYNLCKTRRANYDSAVKAVLMLMQSEGYLIKWSFDGNITDYEYTKAITLLQTAGIKYNNSMKSME